MITEKDHVNVGIYWGMKRFFINPGHHDGLVSKASVQFDVFEEKCSLNNCFVLELKNNLDFAELECMCLT